MQCANEVAQGSMLLVPVLQQEWTHDGVKVVNHCLLCGSRYAADGRALTATPLGHLPRSMLVLIHNLISVFLPTFFADVHFPSIACARGPPAPYDMIQNNHCRHLSQNPYSSAQFTAIAVAYGSSWHPTQYARASSASHGALDQDLCVVIHGRTKCIQYLSLVNPKIPHPNNIRRQPLS